MKRSAATLERFVRRVHRRWIVLRAVESAGVGAAIGCAAALALVPVLLWRDQPAVGVALVLIAVTGAAGLLFGLTRRPSLLAAAVEADRQLALHDLLASALESRHGKDEWTGAVVAMAEARCRDLSPDAILLNRLGVRAWSGIGLAAALVMTLSLLSSRPEPSIASNTATVARRPAPPRAPNGRDVPPSIARRDADATRSSAPAARDPLVADSAHDDSSGSLVNANDNAAGSSSGSAGTGLGAAHTDDAASRDVASARDESSDAQRTSNETDGTSSGGGRAGDAARGDGRDVTGSAADSAPHAAVAPWTSSTWSDAQREAHHAIESRRVPDAYRDLIRDYFAPEQE